MLWRCERHKLPHNLGFPQKVDDIS